MTSTGLKGEALDGGRAVAGHQPKCGIKLGRSRRNSAFLAKTVLSTRVAIVHNPGMNRQSSYRGYRFPPEIISQAVWLYHRFTLSFRDIEELLAERGVIVTYESLGNGA